MFQRSSIRDQLKESLAVRIPFQHATKELISRLSSYFINDLIYLRN